jgi:hypothetical protein
VEAVDHADAAPDAVADEAAPAEVDGATCPGWFDPASGLCWQDPPDDGLRSWDEAITYCTTLVLGGLGSWHLPTISELRSFIRGCPATETGGTCGVTDACLASRCSDACRGCPLLGGPDARGAYWPPGLGGTVVQYWSSSPWAEDAAFYAWAVAFNGGAVFNNNKTYRYVIRCVRPGP